MKKIFLYIIALSALLLVSCDDMLNKMPRDTFSNAPSFWSNENNVNSYSNKYYDNYGSSGLFYFTSLSDDQASPSFDNWKFTNIPTGASAWSDAFTEIRRINYAISGLKTSTLPKKTVDYYMAVNRLNRAWEYYNLVREYGDVQWVNQMVLNPSDSTDIYLPRTDRDVVMDSVLADLNYAIPLLGANKDKTLWSSDMALAMKSDVCLYEGTFCKYRTSADNGKAPDLNRAKKYLNECVVANDELMKSGRYGLTTNYGEIYNSLDLNPSPEVIFYRNFAKDVNGHGLVDYTCGSTEQKGITKDAFDSFLFLDGKPKATTSMNTDDKAVENASGHFSIKDQLERRDKRLSVLIDTIVSFKNHGWARERFVGDKTPNTSEMTSSTGYTIRKYDNFTLDTYYRTNTTTNYTDVPLYWYAVILLNDAEAKAELGTISNSDLDRTINLLQKRAGLPDMTTKVQADPDNDMNVSDLIWEIRRVRRNELMTDKEYRYWDLVRWHQLDKLDTQKNPDIKRGVNLTNLDDKDIQVDAQGYKVPFTADRKYESKHYLFPIPLDQLKLSNGMTKQNFGW